MQIPRREKCILNLEMQRYTRMVLSIRSYNSTWTQKWLVTCPQIERVGILKLHTQHHHNQSQSTRNKSTKGRSTQSKSTQSKSMQSKSMQSKSIQGTTT